MLPVSIETGDRSKYHVIFVGKGKSPVSWMKGNFKETLFVAEETGAGILYVGTGEKLREKNQVKELAAAAVKEMKRMDITEFSLESSFGEDALADLVEGLALGSYESVRYPAGKERKTLRVYMTGEDTEERRRIIKETLVVSNAAAFARDLVNCPANMLRPADFAARIGELMTGLPVKVSVINREMLAERHMNALLTVGDGSDAPPCMVVLEYRSAGESAVTALVGKGVTCDTGGYCLKPADSMGGIKGDMAGAAAVTAAVYALASNGISCNVTGVLPLCENRIAPGAMIPGDVITSYSGKTIEILNTDAEGRLILADAISYAVLDCGAQRVLDIATLTGAMAVALGNGCSGTLSDDEEFYRIFEEASAASGERFHRMPWYREHEEMIKSDVAEIKNTGGGHSGSITAGLFLREFARQLPWIHVDIAGTASVDPPLFAYQSKGGTGVGVFTLYELIKKLTKC